TIASGLTNFNLPVFILASIATRGARFFIVAGLLRFYGPPIRAFIERRLALVTSAFLVLLVGGFPCVRYAGYHPRARRVVPSSMATMTRSSSAARRLATLVVIAGLAPLAVAFASQYWGGPQPCVLCWYQRYPSMAIAALGIVGMLV